MLYKEKAQKYSDEERVHVLFACERIPIQECSFFIIFIILLGLKLGQSSNSFVGTLQSTAPGIIVQLYNPWRSDATIDLQTFHCY